MVGDTQYQDQDLLQLMLVQERVVHQDRSLKEQMDIPT